MDYLIHHLMGASAAAVPDKEAIVCGDVRLSYETAWERVCGIAAGLRELGLQRGDRIGIYTEASAAQALAIFAVSRAGGVFVPINEVLFPEQVAHIANNCGMKGLITSRGRLDRALSALGDASSIEFLVVDDDAPTFTAPVPARPLEELAATRIDDDWSEWSIGNDLAALIYTSGSTGRPKGVMLSHCQVLAGGAIVSSYLGITREHRTLAALPFSFDAGLNQLMTAMQHGATVVIKPFVFARELVQALVDEEITGMGGVPPLWGLIAQRSSGLHKHDYPHLRYLSNTGGAMPLTTLDVLRANFESARVFLMYGLTEAFRSTYLPPEELDRRPTSMGKAIPNTEILVVDGDGRPCEAGDVGELVHRGPTVSMGYWGDPEQTARVIRPHPALPSQIGNEEKVVYSGDLVRTDDEGFLFFVGRRDAMIKSSGFRVSPNEVESALFQSGRLREAAVIGLPDDLAGQTIKAFVVARDGEELDVDALVAFCAERMPRHMVPKSIEMLSTLPKTGSGKIDYPALRRREGLAR